MNDSFDLASIRSRLLPQTPTQSQEKLASAGVAIVVNPDNKGGAVLLIRRTERINDPWSGQIGFPGGHKRLSDNSLVETAIRETSEEVGIELTRHGLLGTLPLASTRSRKVLVASFVFVHQSRATMLASREVAESFWVPLSELHQFEVVKREVNAEEGTLEVNSYEYQGWVIWGLTFRILNLLLGRTLEDDL